MSVDRNSTIAQIVLEHTACARVFRNHRIDFCCRGERTLSAACAERDLDLGVVTADLEHAIAQRSERLEPDLRRMPTAEVVSFIVSRHHAYVGEALRFLEPLATKVARVHGDQNPNLEKLRDALHDFSEALVPHMREEERVLFPALMARSPDRRLVAVELATMHEEHLHIGSLLARMRAYADDFAVPAWACSSYRTLMRELEDLELDTLRHVHLETHVLMPRFGNNDTERGAVAP